MTFVRHGKSAYPYGVDDWSRPLGDRGNLEVPRLGQALAALVADPVTVLVSTAKRAQETWRLLEPWFPASVERSRDDLYEASGREIIEMLGQWESAQRLMIVGHNPGLEDAISWFVEHPVSLPTGSAYVLRESVTAQWHVAAYVRGRYLLKSQLPRES